jgi:large subunit ribosomal protein L22
MAPTTTTGARAESRATVRHLGVSPNKVRPVLDLMRGMSAEDAERLLQLQPRTAAGHVLKLLESAIANADHNQQIPIDELYVVRCWADEGPTRKWGQARARGRYFRVRKRSSHVTIILARYSDEELRTRRGRDEVTGAGPSGRIARRRADRVRASRAAARGETVEEHDHDHDHDHEGHDHDHETDDVIETEASVETDTGAAATTETSAADEGEADADATMSTDEGEANADATMKTESE